MTGSTSPDLRRFFDLTRDMVAVAAPDGHFIYANAEWERVLGWPLAELMSKPFLDFVHPDDVERTKKEAAAIFGGEEKVQFENRYMCIDGSYRWLQWSSRLDNETGNVYAVARDNTELRNAEESRLRMLHHIAHDLAGPIAPLALQVALMRRVAGESVQKNLNVMERNVSHLRRLVEDVQDVLRIEGDELRLNVQRTDLSGLVHDVAGMYPEAEGPRLRVEAEDAVEADVDAHRMKRVLVNLVHNARKFTPEDGAVLLRGWADDSEAHLAVADTGRGLEPDEQQRLFQPFSQVHELGSVEERGTGLGLYICKGIVEGHGGRIWVESAGRGQGSTFHVAVPRPA